MKKLYILLSVTLISYTGYCQNVYGIEADSIKLSNGSSNSELIIENSTRNVPGFLYNIGNGRTEFREVLNGGQNGDSAAYHSIQQGTDSTYFTISNLNGTIDTVQLIYDSSTVDVGSGVTQAQLDDTVIAIRNDKQDKFIVTTTGTGEATLSDNVLNIPLLSDKNFAENDLTASSDRYHNFNYHNLTVDLSRKISLLTDTLKLKTRTFLSVGGGFTDDTTTFSGSFLVQYGEDSATNYGGTIYSDGVNGSDARGSFSAYVVRGGYGLVIERRYTFDSIPFSLKRQCISNPDSGYVNIGIPNNIPAYATLYDRKLGISTPIHDTLYYKFKWSVSNCGVEANRFVVLFTAKQYNGYSTIIADPDSSGIPNNILYMDKDTMKVAAYPIKHGTATLSSGTATVNDMRIKSGAKILVSVNTPSGTQGFLSAKTSDIVNGTSFIINSTSATDESTVNYMILNP